MNEQRNTVWPSIIFIIDMVLSATGFFLGGHIAGYTDFAAMRMYVLSFSLLIGFFFAMYDLYKTRTDIVYGEVVSAALSVLFSGICMLVLSLSLKWLPVPIGVLAVQVSITAVILLIWRTFLAIMIKRFGKKKKCMIIESVDNTSRLARKLKYSPRAGRESTYYMIDENNQAEVDLIINEEMNNYDLIFISPAISSDTAQRIVSRAFILGKTISVLADLDSVSTFRGSIYQVDDTPVIEKRAAQMSMY